MQDQSRKTGPLAGVTVIEFCQALAGPYCGMLLSDLGARVIKVEKPGGDDSRGMPPHFIEGTSVYFMSINRGKESLVVDLKQPAARKVMLDLVAKADIVIENNRPGVMDRLGLGFEDLKAVNPSITMCSISGFGKDGPYSNRPAYDMIVQAMSGGMSVTGEPDGKPVRSGVPIGDMCAGMAGALAAVSALQAAKATGQAQHADVSMLDVQLSMLSYPMAYHLASGVNPTLAGRGHTGIPEMGAYECSDGSEVLIAPLAEQMWPRVCRALGLDEMAVDPALATRSARIQRREEVKQKISAAFLQRSSSEWIELMNDAGIPATRVNTFADVIADPQIQHREMVTEVKYGDTPTRLIGSPMKFAGVDQGYGDPPILGADGHAILSGDLKLSEQEIQLLEKSGAISTGRTTAEAN